MAASARLCPPQHRLTLTAGSTRLCPPGTAWPWRPALPPAPL